MNMRRSARTMSESPYHFHRGRSARLGSGNAPSTAAGSPPTYAKRISPGSMTGFNVSATASASPSVNGRKPQFSFHASLNSFTMMRTSLRKSFRSTIRVVTSCLFLARSASMVSAGWTGVVMSIT